MAKLKLEITEQHVSLVRYANLQQYYNRLNNIHTEDSKLSEVYKDNMDVIYEEFGLILFGRPEGEFDPHNSEEPDWSESQKKQMDKLFDELSTAIDIFRSKGELELGLYTTKHYDINWKLSKK